MSDEQLRAAAEREVYQWDNHDNYRHIAGEDPSEPVVVSLARAYLASHADPEPSCHCPRCGDYDDGGKGPACSADQPEPSAAEGGVDLPTDLFAVLFTFLQGRVFTDSNGKQIMLDDEDADDAANELGSRLRSNWHPAPATELAELRAEVERLNSDQGWRCFYCGESFTKDQAKHAAEHFGSREFDVPVCLMRVPGEGSLLSALRKAQDELSRYRAEDSGLMRALHAQSADHSQRLRQEEEKGYARGLKDYTAMEERLTTRAETAERERDALREACQKMDRDASYAENAYGQSLWTTGAGHVLKTGVDAVRAALAPQGDAANAK